MFHSRGFIVLFFTLMSMLCHDVLKSCPSLWDPMDCSPPGSFVHGIFQTRILEWVIISYSRRSSQPRDPSRVSCVSCIGSYALYSWATWEALCLWSISNKCKQLMRSKLHFFSNWISISSTTEIILFMLN